LSPCSSRPAIDSRISFDAAALVWQGAGAGMSESRDITPTAGAESAALNGGGPAVVASGVMRRYGEGETAVDALCGISLEVERGKLTAVMGPSGSVKSTLMHILAGLDKPTAGTVTIGGTEITTLGDTALTKLRREHIGFVFQFFNLLPMLTAEENVVLPLTIAGERPEKAWLEELLAKTGLTDRSSHRPAELSGGQQQRVAIARALVSKPTIVFADEPTGNLDSKTSGEILSLMRDSVDTYGQTTVMVTHDSRAAAIADRILFLDDGLIVQEVTAGASSHDVLAIMEKLGA
jgi:putative ABC transport system ATP-binding protein